MVPAFAIAARAGAHGAVGRLAQSAGAVHPDCRLRAGADLARSIVGRARGVRTGQWHSPALRPSGRGGRPAAAAGRAGRVVFGLRDDVRGLLRRPVGGGLCRPDDAPWCLADGVAHGAGGRCAGNDRLCVAAAVVSGAGGGNGSARFLRLSRSLPLEVNRFLKGGGQNEQT